MIDGDDNRNATVEVRYRKKGDRDWKAALPLFRLQHERINRDPQLDVIVPNMFAGSILDLEPDTEYECSFVMSDPDGARGQTRKTVTVRTRADPSPMRAGACPTCIRTGTRVRSSSRLLRDCCVPTI